MAEVGGCAAGPFCGKGQALGAGEGEGRRHGALEAGGADEGVDGVRGAVCGVDGGGGEVGDGRGDEGDVGLGKGFEVAWAGGEAPAPRGEGGEERGEDFGFAGEAVLHVGLEDGFGFELEGRAFHGHGVDAVGVGFDREPEVVVVLLVGSEARAEVFGDRGAFEVVAVEERLPEGWGDPGFAADEGADLGAGDALERWDDLDGGRTRTDDSYAFILEIITVSSISPDPLQIS